MPKLTLTNYSGNADAVFRQCGSSNFAHRGRGDGPVPGVGISCCLLLWPVAVARALTVGMFILTLPLMVRLPWWDHSGWIVILGRNGLLNLGLAAVGIEARLLSVLYTEFSRRDCPSALPAANDGAAANGLDREDPRSGWRRRPIILGGSPLVTFRRVDSC